MSIEPRFVCICGKSFSLDVCAFGWPCHSDGEVKFFPKEVSK